MMVIWWSHRYFSKPRWWKCGHLQIASHEASVQQSLRCEIGTKWKKLNFNILRSEYFSFNLYVYYLTCDFITSTRAFDLLTRALNLPSRAFNLETCLFSLLTRGFELATSGFEFVTHVSELVTRVLLFQFNLYHSFRIFFLFFHDLTWLLQHIESIYHIFYW